MSNWEFTFTGSWPAGLVFLLGATAAFLAWFFYRRKRPNVTPTRFWILTGLRIAAIVAVTLFIMKPVIRFSHSKSEQRQVIVLQDV